LPLSVLLAFKLEWGIAGLWWGCLVAATIQSVIITVFLLRLDWRQEARRATHVVDLKVRAADSETPEEGVGSAQEGLRAPLPQV